MFDILYNILNQPSDSANSHNMYYKHFHPIPILEPYIEFFWVIETSSDPEITQCSKMPADSRATLLLNFSGEPRLTDTSGAIHRIKLGGNLLGAHTKSYTLEHAGDTSLIAAQFRPGGLAPFVDCSVGELTGQTTPFAMLWGQMGNQLCEEIYDASIADEKVELLQQTMLNRFKERLHQSRILYALDQVALLECQVSVEWLSEQVNLSQKQFERQFKHMVGMMPKRYIRLARFQRLVRWLQTSHNTANWATLAAQFGYYDHSHLVKDFQAFVGTTPSEFMDAVAGVVEVAYPEHPAS